MGTGIVIHFTLRSTLAGIMLVGLSIAPTLTGLAHATAEPGPAATLAVAHGGYTVVGKALSAQVARAVLAVENCEARNAPGALDRAGSSACDAVRAIEHRAEQAIIQRGSAVLNAAEPADTTSAGANVPVTVLPQGESTMVFTEVPPSVAATFA